MNRVITRSQAFVFGQRMDTLPFGIKARRLNNVQATAPKIKQIKRSRLFMEKTLSGGSHVDALAVGSDDSVYIANDYDTQVRRFTHDGRLLHTWRHGKDAHSTFAGPLFVAVSLTSDHDENVVAALNGVPELGKWPPGLQPLCSAYVGRDRVFIFDCENERMTIFRPEGGVLCEWTIPRTSRHRAAKWHGLCVGPRFPGETAPLGPSLWLLDVQNNCIHLLSGDGVLVDIFSFPSSVRRVFHWTVDGHGNLYVIYPSEVVLFSAILSGGTRTYRIIHLPDSAKSFSAVLANDDGTFFLYDEVAPCELKLCNTQGVVISKWIIVGYNIELPRTMAKDSHGRILLNTSAKEAIMLL